MIRLILDDPLFPVAACPDQYEGMTDKKVLAIAADAFRRAQALPLRSLARQAQWQTFDAAMAELARRAMTHARQKIREREARRTAP